MQYFSTQKQGRWLSRILCWCFALQTAAQGQQPVPARSEMMRFGTPAVLQRINVSKQNRLVTVALEMTQQVTITTTTSVQPERLTVNLEYTKANAPGFLAVRKGGLEAVRLAPNGDNLQVIFELSAHLYHRIERRPRQIVIYFGDIETIRQRALQAMASLTADLNNANNNARPVNGKPATTLINFKPVIPNYAAVAQSVAHTRVPQAAPTPPAGHVTPAAAAPTRSTAQARLATPSPASLATARATPTPLVATAQPRPKPTPQMTATAKPVPAPVQVKPQPAPSPAAPPQPVSARAGRKNFAEGMKYEARRQWELAAQHFAVADAAEPNNPEYSLHLLRARQNASIALAQQGDEWAAQKDYANAYRAYYLAGYHNPTNQQARSKKERMQQLLQAAAAEQTRAQTPVGYNVANKGAPRRSEVQQQIHLRDISLRQTIENFAESIGLNVLFDESFKDDNKFRLKLQNVTMPKALDLILFQSKHLFEQIDRRTIFIYQDSAQNRQRFEQLQVKTFYLANADLNETKTLVQSLAGQNRQVLPVKHLNALVVRDTESSLRLVEDLLNSIDKNRPEVVIDVNIYEVSRSTSLELGNQLALHAVGNAASLSNLGGLGRAALGALAGQTFTAGAGTIIGLPPSSLSLLQSKGHSRLLANTQIHALDGENNQTKVGRSVPVRVGTTFVPGLGNLNGAGSGAPGAGGGLLGGAAIDNVQYKDVGLIIDVTPTIINDNVQIKMRLESTNVEASGADFSLTPSFTQRSLTTIARVQHGQTAIVAGVKQEAKGESRVSLPVIGMIPILGRLFSTPHQSSNLSDIVITVTPHVMRAAEFKPEDHLARHGGTFAGGVTPTIEALYERAETEDEEERRLVAQSSPAPSVSPAPTAPAKLTAPPAAEVKPAGFQTNTQPVIDLSLLPNLIEQEVGESFFVTVSLYGQVKLNDAQVSLRFDPALLSLKSVRSGGLLGSQAHINHRLDAGHLRIKVQQAQDRAAPVSANGQLLLLEFTALNAGQTLLDVDLGETELRQGGGLTVQMQKQNARIRIHRNGLPGQ